MMTAKQKEKIRIMREMGCSFAWIAEDLSLPVSTVKSYYRRNLRPAESEAEAAKDSDPPANEQNACKCCGAPVVHTPKAKKRRFCSPACRSKWWNKYRHYAPNPALVTKHCAYCGEAFKSYPSEERKYCGHPCSIRHRFNKDA